jgi:nicotinamide-nucleotide amidase
MLSAEIIAVGSELLMPNFVDTNSMYLTDQLNKIGITVVMKAIVGDDENYLEQALRGSLERTPIIITIGGLGPTEDDVTKKVVARVLRRQLILDDAILKGIEERFKTRGMEMPKNNARQALVLTGSEVLENKHGTAPGLWISTDRNQVMLLPGPPSELQPMFEETCIPRLRKLAGDQALARRIYRTTGLPESSLDARISVIYQRYRHVQTTVLAKPGQVDVRLTAVGKTTHEAERAVQELAVEIERELVEYIFANEERTLEEVVGRLLVEKQATIAVAESCTGGMLAERLTSMDGSSRYFMSGIVTYSNESKIALAGIPPLLLEMQGAVSEEVARGLAEAVREKIGTTIGVGITGIAGPAGGSPEKPVGTVHIAVAAPSGTRHQVYLFPGSRDRVRWQATQAALNMTRRALMEM